MELYKWQRECLKKWEENRYRGIVNVVTGGGKTVLALSAMKQLRERFPETRVRIVVPTIPLANQWKKSLLHLADSEALRPGFFGGGARDDPDRPVMIYVINSARDSLANHMRRDLALNRHVLLICDECHRYTSKENRKIFGFLDYGIQEGSLYCSLGLSATPYGTGNDNVLYRSLGQEIFRYDADAAVQDGVVSPFMVGEVSASFLSEEMKAYAELSDKIAKALGILLESQKYLKEMDRAAFIKAVTKQAQAAEMDPSDPAAAFLMLTYQRKEISVLAKARICCGIAMIRNLRETDRILVFCERIRQAEEMAAMIRREFGRICGIYHSEMTKEARQRILQEFKENQFRILVSCRCLDEGIDVPDANIGIVLSSSAVERQRIQRLGRVIRRAENKSAACLYYIYVRESTDDAAYLRGLEQYESFSLRYYPAEDVFSNDLYEYVAGGLLTKAVQRGYSPKQLSELRSCVAEGVFRADYLLAEKEQEARIRNAGTVHERNYWNVMKKVGDVFQCVD